METIDERKQNHKNMIGKLPFYDFILLGHSEVGKTTYLTMLCWVGGNKNQDWNFKAGGSGLDVLFIPPDFVKEKHDKMKFVASVDFTANTTGKEINEIFKKIGEQDGSFSTIAPQELVFSFRPTGVEKEHTLLTLDYPGEWLSVEKPNEERIEQFSACLCRSQALIIMIDPLSYIENNKVGIDYYSKGLEEAQNRLRAKDRPGKFVPVNQMPVAVIINKADLLGKNFLKMNPEEFLKNNCRNFYNSVNKLSKNWKAFFVTCYGIDLKLEKIDDRGAYKPPPASEIKPFNLNRPFEWIYRQNKLRTLRGTAKKTLFIIILLCLICAGILTWDTLSFKAIERQEAVYAGEPGLLYEKYTGFDNLHIAIPLTGFKEKCRGKRKHWINEYLNLKLKNPNSLKVPDFKGIIAQVREWRLADGDETFFSPIEARLKKEVYPPFETCYARALYNETERDKYEKGFEEFQQFFPGSPNYRC